MNEATAKASEIATLSLAAEIKINARKDAAMFRKVLAGIKGHARKGWYHANYNLTPGAVELLKAQGFDVCPVHTPSDDPTWHGHRYCICWAP